MDIFNPQTENNLPFQEAQNLATKNMIALDMLKSNIKDAFACLHNNPNATSQEILDVYGENAASLFIAFQKAILFINSLDPTWEPPVSPKEFTINPDGTVTIISNES